MASSKKTTRADGTFRGSGGAAQLNPLTELVADRLLTEREVADRLNWSPKTLQRRRWLGLPPAWVKIGRSVRYEPAIIDRLIADGSRFPATDWGA